MNVKSSASTPYFGLCLYYFASCGLYGVIVPYWMLWMRHHGYSALQIGGVTSAQVVIAIAGTYFWGMLSDKTGKPMPLIRLALTISTALFSLIYLVQDSYIGILLVMAGSAFFWQGAFAQFELVTLRHLGPDSSHYSLIRLTGSLGFIVCVWGVGQLLNRYSVNWLPSLILATMAVLWGASLLNRGGERVRTETHATPIWPMLRRPAIALMVVLFFLSNLSHGSYYGFYSLYLEQLGFTADSIGNLWSVAVIFELLMFAVLPWMLKRVSMHTLLLVSLLITIVRWGLMATQPTDFVTLAGLQILHGFSFSWVHSIAIILFKQFFDGETEGRGQALYGGVCVAAGQAVGIACAGYMWHAGVTVTFGLSALTALVAALLAVWINRYLRRSSAFSNDQLMGQ